MKLLSEQKSTLWILCAILVVAFLMRFAFLDRPDLTNDEALNAARAEVWFDFLGDDRQTTPVQWFETRQWWQSLSFHDHPPFGFAFEWVSVRVFGDSVMGLRLPFVAVGLLSIVGIFLLMRSLFNDERAGLCAAFFMALYPGAVWIFRLALFDGLVIFFIIVSLYFFVRASQGNNRAWLWWGITLGLGVITKYTIFFIVPLFAILVVWKYRNAFKNKWLWYGIGTAVFITTPVVIYNIMMFKTRGHFDAALSSMVGMQPADFALIAGRAGSVAFRHLYLVWVKLTESFGWFMTTVGIVGIVTSIGLACKKRSQLVDLIVVVYVVLLEFTAPFLSTDKHFLTIWTPLLALAGGSILYRGWSYIRQPRLAMATIVVIAIIFYATSQSLYMSSAAGGYNALYRRVDALFKGAVPDLEVPLWKGAQVNTWQMQHEQVPAGFRRGGATRLNTTLVIMDQRIDWVPRFWISTRYATHHLLPVFLIKNFAEYLKAQNVEPVIFIDYGITDVYTIQMVAEPQNENEHNIVTALGQVRTIFKNDPRFKEERQEILEGPTGDDFIYVHHLIFQ